MFTIGIGGLMSSLFFCRLPRDLCLLYLYLCLYLYLYLCYICVVFVLSPERGRGRADAARGLRLWVLAHLTDQGRTALRIHIRYRQAAGLTNRDTYRVSFLTGAPLSSVYNLWYLEKLWASLHGILYLQNLGGLVKKDTLYQGPLLKLYRGQHFLAPFNPEPWTLKQNEVLNFP